VRPSKEADVKIEAIAVIGMAGRFPGANSVDELWRNLCDGRESVSPVSLEEWANEAGLHPAFLDQPDLVRFRPRIDGAEMFDAAFFGYSPREAQILDPQQRVFLECAWEALENAGYDSDRFSGSLGIAAGVSLSTYLINHLQWDRELNATMGALKIGLGNMNDALATRVAYKLNLRGPAYAVQSFCSTSLVAVHLACQSLLSREADMALAGGVTVAVPQGTGYRYQEGGILSPDGHTRTFDAKGRGMVFGNGLGCVVLKRFADARRDRDNVRALILGSAVNNDGSVKIGFTAPSVNGQAEAIVEALSAAGVDPATIGYVEAHGTGTALGDPAEIAGLTKAWRRWTDKRNYCAIGSIKTNIGHLDAAAGVAGLIKTVLSVENGRIPASLHFETPNPEIDFDSSPFYVATRLEEWTPPEGQPRRAGVSSFGIGGTNAHAVLEEAPPPVPGSPARPWQMLVLSAKTAVAADRACERLAAHLERHPERSLADVAFTLEAGRRAFNHRRFVAAIDAADAVKALRDASRVERAVADRQGAPVAFMFTGQGSQYVEMGLGLYESETVFREVLDDCSEALRGPLGLDLRDVLFARGRTKEEAAEELRQTRVTQPALFAVEYALARLWLSLGIEPVAMIGHSVGEYVAACLAGVFSHADALALVAERGRMMQEVGPGAMLAVPLGEAALRPLLGLDVDVASLNTPAASVVSGPREAIAALEERLRARGLATRPLHTSHAFHSAMMDGILPAFRDRVAAVERHPPRLPFVSNVSGDWITAEEAQDPAYWARHLRSAVRFSDGVRRLRARGNPLLLEVGPGNTLTALARQQGEAEAGEAPAIASMRHPKEAAADRAVLLGALGKLWLGGARLDSARLFAGEGRRRVPLPTYPFERERFWVEHNLETREGLAVARGFSPRRLPLSDWFYQVCWQRYLPAEVAAGPSLESTTGPWLVFVDDSGFGQDVVLELRAAGRTVLTVRPGSRFASLGNGAYEIAPDRGPDYVELLAAAGGTAHVVHAWLVAPEDPRPLEARVAESHAHGFQSLLLLAQALDRVQPKRPVQLAIVTSGMHDVVGGDLASPEKATLIGPCRVIPQEFPHVQTHAVDVELLPEGVARRTLARRVLAELTSAQPEPIVAYRRGHRWVQSSQATPLPPANGRLPLREGGVYLVTGGFGGIGLALARHLAERWKARLVLTGRSPLPPREEGRQPGASDRPDGRASRLLELEALGGEVLYVAADAAQESDMRAAVRAARERFGPIQGVVHAAGVPGGGVIPLKDAQAVSRVMAPKVQGTLAVEAALRDEPLDFVLLCSSTSALFGGYGQIDYCGANAFLDAYARWPGSPWAGRVVSVNWDAWRDVGMAVNTPVSGALQTIREFQLKVGITPAEGVEAFDRILGAGLPQLMVVPMDLRPALARQALTRRGELKPTTPDTEAAAATAEPADPARDLTGGELERAVARTWEQVLGRKGLGGDDNFFELGGDSLTALQVAAILNAKLGREIPIVTFYEAPTVSLLARALAGAGSAPTGTPAPLEDVGQRAQTRLELMQRRRRPRTPVAEERG
jgi:acyl transferase domain-containing protein